MARGGYRPGSGPQKGTKYGPRKPKDDAVVDKKPRKPKEPKIPEGAPESAAENLDPLSYMLQVINDPNEDTKTRLNAASLAAPYLYQKAEKGNKKQEKDEKAKSAGAGRFASGAAPLKVVK